MAAATATGSCFSATTSTRCFPSKLGPCDTVLHLTCLPKLPLSTTIAYSLPIDLRSISVTSHKWRLPRIAAAVAQEEVEATETESIEEEKKEVSEGEVEGAPTVHTKLYFGNLPYNVDSAQLAAIIQDYGSPEMVEVLYDRDTGKSRGFAFVTMSSMEDCNAVIENLNGSECGGRTLRVNFSDKPKPKVPLYPETEFKIFVGNLSWSVTSDSLTEVFREYGNVVGARVLYDGETGRSRGYGFVCYSIQEEMDAALQYLNGVELEGRSMRVSPALGKKS
ncbi:28 kDa ribonucleoprotein, chloroplastic [Aristolochia californica]|uniref:28 kDa ribonucleoprotein, chloroplastic n=1 Tax=Aristolochia californica TaxID=171875 RepID=UPI0035D89028